MSRLAQLGLGMLAAFPLLLGCSEDEAAPVVPVAPPTLEIVELKTTADSWLPGDEPAELRLGCDPKRVAGVLVGPSVKTPGRLDNFALNPPGACGSEPQCGPLVFSLESGSGGRTVRAFSIFAQAELAGLELDARYTLRVELRDEEDRPVDVRGELVRAEVQLLLLSPEGCDLDGGLDGPADAGLDSPDERADSSEADAADEGSSDAAGDGENDAGSADAGELDAGGG